METNRQQQPTRIQDRFPRLARGAQNLSERVEDRARKTPGMAFAAAAGASILASGILALSGNRRSAATFVGLWAPSLLLMGIWSNLLKMEYGRGRGR